MTEPRPDGSVHAEDVLGIEGIVTDALAEQPWPPAQTGELTRDSLNEAIRSLDETLRAAREDSRQAPASWHGREQTIELLLSELGAVKRDDPYRGFALGIALVHDDEVAPFMVIERAGDGTILRAFARAEIGHWYVIAGECVIPPLSWVETA